MNTSIKFHNDQIQIELEKLNKINRKNRKTIDTD